MVVAIGIDPGIVHTGVVGMHLAPIEHEVYLKERLIMGYNPQEVKHAVDDILGGFPKYLNSNIFIEKYRPRSHFSYDNEMSTAVSEIHKALPGSKVLANTGIKKVVRPALLHALELDKFKQASHHQDLLSAARIMILGLLKDEEANRQLSEFVIDIINGRDWHVFK